MQNYENLIYEKLKGSSPREKYENLIAMQKLLSIIAYPRRGTEEEKMSIHDAAKQAEKLIKGIK